MIRAGYTIHSPITKSTTVVLESDAETNGAGWLLEVRCLPGAQSDVAEHFHVDWTETVTIISGEAYYKLNGVQKTAQAGEEILFPPGQLHIHPWCAGDSELIYRQRDHFGRANPQAVQDVLGVFATIAALARQGKVGRDGRPKHPLQMAATLRTLNKYGGYDASIPVPMQKFLSATLGRLANALGYHGVYPDLVVV